MKHSEEEKALICDLRLRYIFDGAGALPLWVFAFVVFTSLLFKSHVRVKSEAITGADYRAALEGLLPGARRVRLSLRTSGECWIDVHAELSAKGSEGQSTDISADFAGSVDSELTLFRDSKIDYSAINATIRVADTDCGAVDAVWESIDPVFSFYSSVVRLGLSVFAAPLAASYVGKLRAVRLSREQHLTGVLVIMALVLFFPALIGFIAFPFPKLELLLNVSRDVFLSYFMYYVHSMMNYFLRSKTVSVCSVLFLLVSCCTLVCQDLQQKTFGVKEILTKNNLEFDVDYTATHKLVFAVFFVSYLVLLCISYFNQNARFRYYSITSFVVLVIFQLHLYVKTPFPSVDKTFDLALFGAAVVMYEYGHLFVDEIFENVINGKPKTN